MFCKRTYCALIVMTELARSYGETDVDITSITRKYDLLANALDSIIKQLEQSGYVIRIKNELSLQIPPDKISIWNIVESIECNESKEFFLSKQSAQTTITMMIDKEMDVVLKMVQYRLQRYKLSTWSEKASKMIYI